jgi:hypothetical protein
VSRREPRKELIMKIKVICVGETEFTADPEYCEPPVREAIAGGDRDDVASTIVDYTDTERSNVSCDEHATVTADDGTVLWAGWITGDPDAPAPGDRWWITTDALAAGGGKVLGPFCSQELALRVRTYMEAARQSAGDGRTYWVDEETAP